MTRLEVMKKVCMVHYEEAPRHFIRFLHETLYEGGDSKVLDGVLIGLGTDTTEEKGFTYQADRIHGFWGEKNGIPWVGNRYLHQITIEDDGWDDMIKFMEALIAAHNL